MKGTTELYFLCKLGSGRASCCLLMPNPLSPWFSVVTKAPVTRVKVTQPCQSIPAVAFPVMGALFFLLLVVLGVLLFRNRALRRGRGRRDAGPTAITRRL